MVDQCAPKKIGASPGELVNFDRSIVATRFVQKLGHKNPMMGNKLHVWICWDITREGTSGEVEA